ncbi:hypothetical protein RvY_13549 [Ramazzottius varieornatus]|uniref:Nucleolar GTP-binding protein 2 n=1 Tax=Ramazzottius varieornatus TaxID=947166 RepID=A0A1D1VN96_RAMVA|nr:hypothetical protein RvY_13549 [Ramazzottius varieornatus]
MGRKSQRDIRTTRKEGFQMGGHSLNPDRPREHAGQRDRATIKRLLMYKNSKPQRNAKGIIVKPAPFQSWHKSGTQSRVEPNRKWFGNTRVVGQSALQTFQDELGKAVKDPYRVVMRPTKLPVTLLNERAKYQRAHLLDVEKFETTFGPKAQRKKPNVKFDDLKDFVSHASTTTDSYDVEKDRDLVVDDGGERDEAKEWIMFAGQSKRIWNELYKVVDSSDVLLQVLDARDPMGTRSPTIEKFLKEEKPFKHLIFILNKCDLVPTWVTKKWVAILSQEYPTLAFHASITNSFGKGPLINILRQFAKLHIDKKQISVGLIGYPNVGKSSIINTLKAKKVVKVAPIPGETKVWQYITLMNRIYLIDCPGVVYPTGNTDEDTVLKGIIRVEHLKSAMDYIPALLERVKLDYIKKTYGVEEWTDSEHFLEQIARKAGRLFKKGEADLQTVAKMILNDFQRGKIPYFVKPPETQQLSTSQGESVEKKATVEIKQSFKDLKHTNQFDAADEKIGQVGEEEEKEEEEEVVEEELTAEEVVVEENEATLDNEPSTSLENGVQVREEKEEVDVADPDVDDVATAKKRWFEKDEQQKAERTLTGKQKRKVERRQRLKKTGVTFYDSVDVKNRSGRLIDPHAPPKPAKKTGKKHQKRV